MIQLSDHFTYRRLLRFTFPSIIMMIFTSIYGVVDGFFVSNYVGKTSFAAVNLIMPVLMILGCVGFMFGTGGAALVAMTLGEKKEKRAREIFSMIVCVSALAGLLLAVLGMIFLRPIAILLKAEGQLLEDCVLYGRIILSALPFFVLQYEFQCLFSTAEKPKLGLLVTVAAGCTNMVLDALFVAVFNFGVVGAAVATAMSQFVGGFIPILYFAKKRGESKLYLCRFRFDGKALLKSCSNGASEFMSNVSFSLVGMLYNLQLIRFAGENGIAAYGVLMYVSMIFQAIFIGYAVGVSPIVGYHYGAQNHAELKGILKKSLILTGIASVLMFAAGEGLARPLSALFVGYDETLFSITLEAFFIYSFSFLLCGIPIFGSSFFTALNDGLTSALISFLRTLVFQVAFVLIMPEIWQLTGIWLSIVFAEVAAVVVTVCFLIGKRKKYGY